MKPRVPHSSNRKSILYHLHVIDEQSEIAEDLSEYPCQNSLVQFLEPDFKLPILVKSVNFVVLGKQDIASEYGKKGTESDLTLYDRKESDVIKTWVTPSGFPEKIQPLFQAINLAEYVIFGLY